MDISEVDDTIKAPPMSMISMRLKSAIETKKEFVSFVKDYIQNPSKEKGFCMKVAYEHFGVMPAIGTKMSEKERDVIANWMYDNFSGKELKSNNSSMKCGAGKCGSDKCGSK
jgi:hypothetical protein